MTIPTFLFLQYLLYMELGIPAVDFRTEHCYAMKSGSRESFGNRVCSESGCTDSEIQQIKDYFDVVPFRWLVPKEDTVACQQLERAGLRYICDYPAMIVDVHTIRDVPYPAELEIKIITHEKDWNTWIDIVARSFGMNAAQFATFVTYIRERAKPGMVTGYLGYYNNIPVATAMVIKRGDIVSVHWIGTLTEYRGKGIGYALTHKPLLDAYRHGCKQAILLATDLGKPVYEKLGFTTYATYAVYSKS